MTTPETQLQSKHELATQELIEAGAIRLRIVPFNPNRLEGRPPISGRNMDQLFDLGFVTVLNTGSEDIEALSDIVYKEYLLQAGLFLTRQASLYEALDRVAYDPTDREYLITIDTYYIDDCDSERNYNEAVHQQQAIHKILLEGDISNPEYVDLVKLIERNTKEGLLVQIGYFWIATYIATRIYHHIWIHEYLEVIEIMAGVGAAALASTFGGKLAEKSYYHHLLQLFRYFDDLDGTIAGTIASTAMFRIYGENRGLGSRFFRRILMDDDE